MYSISFLILISALCMVLYGSTDWSTVLADLQAQKALWSANGIIDYVFKQNTQCYCPACTVANKYVLIEDKIINTDGTPIYVEFDSTSSIGTDCEVTYPLDENYFNVTSYYDAAITFVQEKVDAGCDNGVSTNPFITCDGSITFNYDDTLYYPTLIYIEFNACGAACDAFISYNIDCLTAINTDDNTNIPPSYTNTCNDFTVPTSSSGEECPLRCESGFDGCNDCTCDGLGNFGGCTRRGCPDGTIAPAATCSMCEIGYEVNTVTNECESVKVSCANNGDCDAGFKCRTDPECREYTDLQCSMAGKVCVTGRALETVCNSDGDCDQANGFGCLDGDRGDGRCLKYQSA